VRRVVYLAAAKRDLVSIVEYVTRQSGSLATGRWFVEQIRGRCAKLASLPRILGRSRPELGPDTRSIPFKEYVIFFRYRGESFEVVNVIEGHRDIEGYFRHEEK
jgi:toxin ParE1/3/4